jgi:hypothetical protein
LPYTDITCAADGVVYEVHGNPNDHPYGIHIRIRHAFGYRTIYGHLAKTMVGWGQKVAAGDVIGKADTTGATTASHLHFSLKQDGATARHETVYPKDIIDPTPFMVWPDSSKTLDPQARPAGKCLIGADADQAGGLTSAAISTMAHARLEAVRISPDASDDAIVALRNEIPGAMIVVRLEADFSGEPIEPGAFVRRVEENTRRLVNTGVHDFELLANPNLQSGGWRRSWRDGDEFAKWFLRVTGRLRKSCPDARWGFPGLSPGDYVSGWREDTFRFLEEADAGVEASDWIGVNCHWTNSAGMRSIQGGLAFQLYRARFPGKLLMITEFENGSTSATEAEKADQYLAYYGLLRDEPGVVAAFAHTPSNSHPEAKPVLKTPTAQFGSLFVRLSHRGF